MPYLNSIGIKNFRTFDNNSSFEFSQINLITGVNNAGKSSITKLLLLLKDSFKINKFLNVLDFTGKEHALGYFENAICTSNINGSIIITLPFQLLNSKDYKIELAYSSDSKAKSYQAICNNVKIYNSVSQKPLIEIYRTVFTDDADNYWESIQDSFDFKIDSKQLYSDVKAYKENVEAERALRKAKAKEIYGEQFPFDLKVNESSELPEEQRRYFSFEERKAEGLIDLGSENVDSFLDDQVDTLLRIIDDFLKFENKKRFRVSYQITGEDIVYLYNRSTEISKNLIQSAIKFVSFDSFEETTKINAEIIQTRILLEHILTNAFQKLEEAVSKNLISIPLYRGTIKRLHPADGNVLDRTINELADFYNKHDFILPKIFINEWLERFDIDGFNTLDVIKYFEYEVSTLLLKLKDPKESETRSLRRKTLSDLGFGSAQVILLLSKIAVEARKHADYDEDYEELYFNPHILLIEEPEAHLHPRWQSLLADVIIDACDRFKTQFIIETHSEYLIRRIQYNVYKKVISPDNVKIYQIQKDSNYNSESFSMALDYTGKFKHQFVDGFFDEKTTLQDEIDIQNQLEKYKKDIESIMQKHHLNIRCVVLTEDSNAGNNYDSGLSYVLRASGFKQDQYKITSYKTSGDKRLAAGMAKILEQNPSIELVIWHIDCDGQPSKRLEEIQKIIKDSALHKTVPFITKYNDIEGYFTRIDHLQYLYTTISRKVLEEIVSKAEEMVKEKSIRVLTEHFNKNKEVAELAYKADPILYRHSKSMIKHINKQVTDVLKLPKSASIVQFSQFLVDNNLCEYLKRINSTSKKAKFII